MRFCFAGALAGPTRWMSSAGKPAARKRAATASAALVTEPTLSAVLISTISL
jgi:hypothetical protein